MATPVAPPPSSIAGRPRPSPRTGVAGAIGFSVAAVALVQGYDYLARYLTVTESYLGLVAVPVAVLGLLLLAARWERRTLAELGFCLNGPWGATVAFASLLGFLYLALRLDPGFIFGFGKTIPPSPVVFGFFLLTAPLAALAEVALFVGYAFRTVARELSLPTAMIVSAGFFAAYSTDGAIFQYLDATSAVQYILTTTLVAFVLGIVLALYFYKSGWSLLGPVALASALTAIGDLLPVGVRFPSWEVDFVSSLFALAALLIVVGIGLRESRLQSLWYLDTRIGPRRFRFRDRARDRAALRSTLAGAAAVGLVVLSITYVVPVELGTTTPFLAIATGSMVPTFTRGEFVVVEHVAPTAIHVGTIIAFSVSCLPSPTVHRVIRIVSAGPNWVYQTKGDANPVQDPCTVPYSDVHGAVVFYVPYLGFLVLDPLFAAAIVAVLILVPLLWRSYRA
jgi:signal peptidase I